jgi:hypothetical protein
VNSNTVSVTVSAALTVSVAPAGPVTLAVGQAQLFSATVSGGTGTRTYQWYLDGTAVSGQTASTYTYTAVISGSHSVYVRVTDSASTPVSVNSNTVSITVNPVMTVSVSPAGPLTMDVSQAQLFSATVSGGTGVLSFQWYLDGSVVSGSVSSTYTYTAVEVGSPHSIYVKVTDSATPTKTATSTTIYVTVNPSTLFVSVSPTSLTMNYGEYKTFRAIASGGSGIYSGFQWYVDGSAQAGETGSTFSFGPTSKGVYSITVTITDSLGATSQSSVASIKAQTPPPPPVTIRTSNPTENSVVLSWTQKNTVDFLKYDIFVSQYQGSLGSFIGTINDQSITSYDAINLKSATTYYFTVRTVNSIGGFADSNQVSIKTPDTVNPFLLPLLIIFGLVGCVTVVAVVGKNKAKKRALSPKISVLNQSQSSASKPSTQTSKKINRCNRCGKINLENFEFCGECGARIGDDDTKIY